MLGALDDRRELRGETGLAGVAHGVERALLHLDFGVACGWPGCPGVRELWTLGIAADISMLVGTIVIGIGGGFANPGLFIDCPTLTGLAVRGPIFVVVLSFAMDAVVCGSTRACAPPPRRRGFGRSREARRSAIIVESSVGRCARLVSEARAVPATLP